jgi:Uma2 family endonuclease
MVAMKTIEFVSIEDYLRTAYDLDCDYVDGKVLKRSVGERDHSEMQREFLFFFRSRQQAWTVFVFPEQRVQVSSTRFRVPDLCVYAGSRPHEQIFQTPPLHLH